MSLGSWEAGDFSPATAINDLYDQVCSCILIFLSLCSLAVAIAVHNQHQQNLPSALSFFKFFTLWDKANMKNGREEATVRKVGRVWAGGRRGKLETSSFEKSHVRWSSDCCLSLERCTVSFTLFDTA